MRDTGRTEPVSITPIRLFIRFTPEDAFYEDWWVPTEENEAAIALAHTLGLEFEVQTERMAMENAACSAPVEKYFRRFAEQLKDPACFERMKRDFYALNNEAA